MGGGWWVGGGSKKSRRKRRRRRRRRTSRSSTDPGAAKSFPMTAQKRPTLICPQFCQTQVGLKKWK